MKVVAQIIIEAKTREDAEYIMDDIEWRYSSVEDGGCEGDGDKIFADKVEIIESDKLL